MILHLFAENVGEVDAAEVLPVLVIAVLGAALALGAAALVFRDARRGALVATAAVVVLLGYGHVAAAVAPSGVPRWALGVALAAAFLASVVVALRIGPRIVTATRALNVIAGVLVLITIVGIVPSELGASSGAGPSPLPTRGNPGGPQRDIWFLVFDRYGSDRVLEEAYRIDNHLPEDLEARGFFVADESYANYVKTSLSLAATLNLTYLDEVARRQGPDSDDHSPVFEMLQDHVVGRFLQSLGYRYIHVGSAYGPTDANRLADENPRPGGPSDFASAVVDLSALPVIGRRLGLIPSLPSRERYYRIALFQFETLERIADRPGPKFVFAHLLLPHPPYVFTEDGSFVDEDGEGAVAAAYAGQLAYTNRRIEGLVEHLLDRPEAEQPIIVLEADEGPYPPRYGRNTVTFDWSTASETELRMKYGILNAVFLPGLDETPFYPTVTPVNTFRLIFERYFGTDTPPLPDRIYTSRGKFRPYDLTDVTDRLLGPAAP